MRWPQEPGFAENGDGELCLRRTWLSVRDKESGKMLQWMLIGLLLRNRSSESCQTHEPQHRRRHVTNCGGRQPWNAQLNIH